MFPVPFCHPVHIFNSSYPETVAFNQPDSASQIPARIQPASSRRSTTKHVEDAQIKAERASLSFACADLASDITLAPLATGALEVLREHQIHLPKSPVPSCATASTENRQATSIQELPEELG